jgi:hypothetical protein
MQDRSEPMFALEIAQLLELGQLQRQCHILVSFTHRIRLALAGLLILSQEMSVKTGSGLQEFMNKLAGIVTHIHA